MRVFIADDSVPVRELLIELLSEYPEIEVVGQTDDALEATEAIEKLKPDVVTLDLRLRRGSGMGVLGVIKKKMPSVIVMMLSGQPNPAYQRTCQDLGADFYFRKSDGFEEVVKTLIRLASPQKPHPE